MLNGISRVVNAYGDAIKDIHFKERLGRISIKELSRNARDRRAGSLGYAEAIVNIYNKKNHSSLPMNKLYTHIKKKDEENTAEINVAENYGDPDEMDYPIESSEVETEIVENEISS